MFASETIPSQEACPLRQKALGPLNEGKRSLHWAIWSTRQVRFWVHIASPLLPSISRGVRQTRATSPNLWTPYSRGNERTHRCLLHQQPPLDSPRNTSSETESGNMRHTSTFVREGAANECRDGTKVRMNAGKGGALSARRHETLRVMLCYYPPPQHKTLSFKPYPSIRK
jgi:hypothetical protein